METNLYVKKPLRVRARIAYVYPSIYRVMISGLAMDIVYHVVNRLDEVYLERFTCSKLYGPEAEARSIETGSPLRDFALILVTIHYEPDIVNLARLLLASGIPVLSRNREKHTVVAGGPVCMENPVPYSDVVDACVVGEAEVTLKEVIDMWLEYGDSKKRFLEKLASLNYTYVPGLSSEPIKKRYVEDLNASFYPTRQVENTLVEPLYGRGFKLEVSRGCPFWCSFCIETRVFQPYRERGLGTLKKLLEEGSKYTISGKRVILFSLAFPITSTHYELLNHLKNEGFKASTPSLRVSRYLEKSLDLIKDLGQRTLVLAPETFSSTIQFALFKYSGLMDYVNSVLEETLRKGFDLKLYLIYGFKGLEDLDTRINIERLKQLVHVAKQYGRRITVSINPLIPKPHTPFQWIGMLPRDRLSGILRTYKNELRGLVEARAYDIDWAIVQSQLALSTRPLGQFIEAWARFGGSLAGWRRAVREMGVNYKYVFTGYSTESELPWNSVVLCEYCEKVNELQYLVYEKLTRKS